MNYNLQTIDEKTFTSYALNHNKYNVLQTSETANRRSSNHLILYLGLFNDDNLIGVGIFAGRSILFNYKEFDCRMGPLVDNNNIDLYLIFLNLATSYLKSYKGYRLLINPNEVINYYNNELTINTDEAISKLRNKLKDNNYHEITNPLKENSSYLNWYYFKDMSIFDNEEELLKSIDNKAIRDIRYAQKNCVYVREITSNEFDIFEDCLNHTSERRHYDKRSTQYYKELHQLHQHNNSIKYMGAFLDTVKAIDELNSSINLEETLLTQLNEKGNGRKIINQINECNIRLSSLYKRLEMLKNLPYKSDLLISCAIFFIYPTEVIYFVSGSYSDTMIFNGVYLLLWEMLRFTYNNKIPLFNFYGTNGTFNNYPEQHGIYEFKRSFNGYLVEMIGYYYKDMNPLVANIISILKKVKSIIKK